MSFFFFQAEDGIRDLYVTGVQTCALPILISGDNPTHPPGFNQIAEPCYIWNNTNDGSPFNNFVPETSNIQQGIHYFNNTIPTGYMPYTYPHPMIVVATPNPTPSSTPSPTATATATVPPT